ncbi:sigma-54-dependent Fis family transcriptional regulator [Schlesneria paludicola]|uniref:sigma-54-dependent Fis family transcriptional regulator n=1 Tax=Schlesneria paludicola TaxID=360056 RepID=UPI00029AAFED|nr:sigma-54-dependent Fis family transcriptional regulator [Schlesneria paludicola]
MTMQTRDSDTAIIKTTAHLVVRSGLLEGTIVPLHSGQVTTIGRATTNRLVIPDEICSRNHCEVFFDGGVWKLRDLGSRNGTRVNGEPITGDLQLTESRQFQIGNTVVSFTRDPRSRSGSEDEATNDTVRALASDTVRNENRGSSAEPRPEIVHLTDKTRYMSADSDALSARDRAGQEAQRLVKLGLKMGAETDIRRLSEIVLDGLFGVTSADLGAVLLFKEADIALQDHRKLDVVAYKSLDSRPFERVSDYVSSVVLESRAAVVAHDVSSDDKFKSSDSLRAMRAESIICAPIRTADRLLGLIQLYSTNPDNRLEPDDAEFALAVADQLAGALENLKERSRLAAGLARVETENKTLREQLLIETELVGDSESIRRLREKILRIAPTGATVLIRGESGVGKELVARAIHQHSNRADGPFVTMNCAALSESLLESELFGHEKGSFTGAVGRKIGKFEQAHSGTIFLDEVGEMSPAIQAKFLRVLEGHPYERVGGGTEVRVDVRVVAATNRDLEDSVDQGRFRKDLYFRLQVMELLVEPLRERRTDIAILAKHFMQRFSKKCGRSVTAILPAALSTLTNYGWPGNVRELQNTIERAVILCSGDTIGPNDVQLSALGRSESPSLTSSSSAGYRPVSIDIIEQEHILATLEWTKWNKSQAAHILEIERSTLDRKLKKYEVERPSRR